MNLILDTPADFAVGILSEWLKLKQLCRLEVAMCSANNRIGMGPIYEALSVENYPLNDETVMEKQLDWLLVRRIRLRWFKITQPLQRPIFSKVAALLRHSQSTLRTLDVYENEELINVIGVTAAKYCSQIETLKINRMNLTVSFFTMLGGFNNLKTLVLYQCENFGIECLNDVSCLPVCTLCMCGNFSVQIQKALLKVCPKLVSYSISIAEVVDLDELSLTVQSINVHGCGWVQAENMKADLTRIHLHGCNANDEDVASIFASCSQVQELSLQGRGALTDVSMRLIGEKYGHSLQIFSFRNCGPITTAGLNCLFRRCKALTSLGLEESAHTDSACIRTAFEHCINLRTLDISRSELTDEVLARIAAFPLETLDLRLSTGYSEVGIVALMNGCATLKLLLISNKLINPVVRLLWKQMRPKLRIQSSNYVG